MDTRNGMEYWTSGFLLPKPRLSRGRAVRIRIIRVTNYKY